MMTGSPLPEQIWSVRPAAPAEALRTYKRGEVHILRRQPWGVARWICRILSLNSCPNVCLGSIVCGSTIIFLTIYGLLAAVRLFAA